MMSYPEFFGGPNEDVGEFLERFELACINNHVGDEGQVLKMLRIFLKGDAKDWLKSFEAKEAKAVPPRFLTLDRLTKAFLERFQQVEDSSVLWQQLSELRQERRQDVDDFLHVFIGLWDHWCFSLSSEAPPNFAKKGLFMNGLLPALKIKVEGKNPKTFEDALRIARDKEWKRKKMAELGVYREGMHEDLLDARKDASSFSLQGIPSKTK